MLIVLFFVLSLSYVCYPPDDDAILHRSEHWSKRVEQLQGNEHFKSICEHLPVSMRNLFDKDKPLRRITRTNGRK